MDGGAGGGGGGATAAVTAPAAGAGQVAAVTSAAMWGGGNEFNHNLHQMLQQQQQQQQQQHHHNPQQQQQQQHLMQQIAAAAAAAAAAAGGPQAQGPNGQQHQQAMSPMVGQLGLPPNQQPTLNMMLGMATGQQGGIHALQSPPNSSAAAHAMGQGFLFLPQAAAGGGGMQGMGPPGGIPQGQVGREMSPNSTPGIPQPSSSGSPPPQSGMMAFDQMMGAEPRNWQMAAGPNFVIGGDYPVNPMSGNHHHQQRMMTPGGLGDKNLQLEEHLKQQHHLGMGAGGGGDMFHHAGGGEGYPGMGLGIGGGHQLRQPPHLPPPPPHHQHNLGQDPQLTLGQQIHEQLAMARLNYAAPPQSPPDSMFQHHQMPMPPRPRPEGGQDTSPGFIQEQQQEVVTVANLNGPIGKKDDLVIGSWNDEELEKQQQQQYQMMPPNFGSAGNGLGGGMQIMHQRIEDLAKDPATATTPTTPSSVVGWGEPPGPPQPHGGPNNGWGAPPPVPPQGGALPPHHGQPPPMHHKIGSGDPHHHWANMYAAPPPPQGPPLSGGRGGGSFRGNGYGYRGDRGGGGPPPPLGGQGLQQQDPFSSAANQALPHFQSDRGGFGGRGGRGGGLRGGVGGGRGGTLRAGAALPVSPMDHNQEKMDGRKSAIADTIAMMSKMKMEDKERKDAFLEKRRLKDNDGGAAVAAADDSRRREMESFPDEPLHRRNQREREIRNRGAMVGGSNYLNPGGGFRGGMGGGRGNSLRGIPGGGPPLGGLVMLGGGPHQVQAGGMFMPPPPGGPNGLQPFPGMDGGFLGPTASGFGGPGFPGAGFPNFYSLSGPGAGFNIPPHPGLAVHFGRPGFPPRGGRGGGPLGGFSSSRGFMPGVGMGGGITPRGSILPRGAGRGRGRGGGMNVGGVAHHQAKSSPDASASEGTENNLDDGEENDRGELSPSELKEQPLDGGGAVVSPPTGVLSNDCGDPGGVRPEENDIPNTAKGDQEVDVGDQPSKNVNSEQGKTGQLALLAEETPQQAISKADSRSGNCYTTPTITGSSPKKLKKKAEVSKLPRGSNNVVDKNNHLGLRERLISQLVTGEAECMVCLEKIKPRLATWDCRQCYQVFHIQCIVKWAGSLKNGGTAADDDGWRCPGCQAVYDDIPRSYFCFCRKVKDPLYDKRETPHSCGEVCGKSKRLPDPSSVAAGSSVCVHKCTELCHPGPCPPCVASVLHKCPCGKTSQTGRCGTVVQCENVCGKPLPCGAHICGKGCHSEGGCGPCQEVVLQNCHCGSGGPVEVGCAEDTAGVTTYSCGNVCGQPLECGGNHRCADLCHPGPCGPCPLLPEVQRTCHCGKADLDKDLGVARRSCSEDIPSCGAKCGRKLPCGNSHTCQEVCHGGPCPPCPLSTQVRCRCGFMENKEVDCKDLTTKADDVRCGKRCNKKRSCGLHKCGQDCCIDFDHICTLTCSRTLTCGLHRCGRVCHPGNCGTCTNVSFDELACRCGAEILYPPIQCGTKPPECARPCTRDHPCGHRPRHCCHSDDECPPCTEFVEKLCFGKHQLRKNVFCYLDGTSCGQQCAADLPCGLHKCVKPCHPGPCLSEDRSEKCAQPCGRETRKDSCGHPCKAPCHKGPCPKTPCNEKVEVQCSCGSRKSTVICSENEKEYQRIRTFELAAMMKELQEGSASSGSGELAVAGFSSRTGKLECNENCGLIERNRSLAQALKIENPDATQRAMMTQRYSDFLRETARRNQTFASGVYKSLEDLVKKAKESKQKTRSFSFECMNREKRQFVHELAAHFGCETKSYDMEPKRNVVATAERGAVWLPPLSLMEAVQGVRKALPPTSSSSSRASIKW